MNNIDIFRSDFPILGKKIYDKPLVYLDNAATTQKPKCVVDRIADIYCNSNGNVHRGAHFLSQQATEAHENARKDVARFINAPSSEQIVFTKGTTEAINMVASSYCREFCKPGDEILITEMEHHSNIVPWLMQQQQLGVKVVMMPIRKNGEYTIDDLHSHVTRRTRMIAISHISNVLGTLNPVYAAVAIARRNGFPVLIDAAQSIQHLSIDVRDLECDFLAFSGHKMYAPNGVGVLYMSNKWFNRLPPYQGGGQMISKVTSDSVEYNSPPYRFEAGTPDYVATAGLATAIDYMQRVGTDVIKKQEDYILDYAIRRLRDIDGVEIIGNPSQRHSILPFNIKGIHHYDVATLLDKMGIAVRAGHHCAQPLMRRLNVEGLVRASFAFYNTREDVDALAKGLMQIKKMF